MASTTFRLDGVDGLPLFTYDWRPDTLGQREVLTVVVLIHGQAERVGRYSRFAKALNAGGVAVVGADIRGHGKTVLPDLPSTNEWAIAGHMADDDGWNKAVADALIVTKTAKHLYPNARVVLFGHSMGSALAQMLVMRQPQLVDALMLAGCWGGMSLTQTLLSLIAWAQYWCLGPRSPAQWINALTFRRFLQPFEPVKTSADWLTADVEEAQKFVDDPLVGQLMSCRHWIDFANGYAYINQTNNLRYIPKDMPVSMWGGGQDTVSNFGKGFWRLCDNYRSVGLTPEPFFYENCRHELLNELDRDAITQQMLDWIMGL